MGGAIYRIIGEKREDLRALELFVDIALNGLDKATKAVHGIELMQKINAALGDPSPFATEEALTNAKARAADVAQFAESEKSRGFPYLFGIAAIRLWSLLEALVDDLAVEALKDPAACKDQILLSRLKGPVAVHQDTNLSVVGGRSARCEPDAQPGVRADPPASGFYLRRSVAAGRSTILDVGRLVVGPSYTPPAVYSQWSFRCS